MKSKIEIDFQDVRLIAGEGKLTAADVLKAVNVILRQREKRNKTLIPAEERRRIESLERIRNISGLDDPLLAGADAVIVQRMAEIHQAADSVLEPKETTESSPSFGA